MRKELFSTPAGSKDAFSGSRFVFSNFPVPLFAIASPKILVFGRKSALIWYWPPFFRCAIFPRLLFQRRGPSPSLAVCFPLTQVHSVTFVDQWKLSPCFFFPEEYDPICSPPFPGANLSDWWVTSAEVLYKGAGAFFQLPPSSPLNVYGLQLLVPFCRLSFFPFAIAVAADPTASTPGPDTQTHLDRTFCPNGDLPLFIRLGIVQSFRLTLFFPISLSTDGSPNFFCSSRLLCPTDVLVPRPPPADPPFSICFTYYSG